MSIVYEKKPISPLASLKLFAGFALCLSAPAFAQEPNLTSTAVAMPSPGMVSSVPAGMPVMPGVAIPNPLTAVSAAVPSMVPSLKSPATMPVMGEMPDPPTMHETHAFAGRGDEKSLSAVESKVSDAAKDSIKTFSSSSENATLDDLNSAKIAIAKIDALIDLEKHLAELEKVRNEREGRSSSIAAAIPAAALAPPPMVMPRTIMREEAPPPMKITATLELQRISGSVGNNSAELLVNGQSKIVHVGDQLADGSLVTGITATGVTVRRDGVVHRLEIKGIDVIYGHTY